MAAGTACTATKHRVVFSALLDTLISATDLGNVNDPEMSDKTNDCDGKTLVIHYVNALIEQSKICTAIRRRIVPVTRNRHKIDGEVKEHRDFCPQR
ncbi:hypothetical protein RB195_014018 [Necator americanus]|uniref:Uncharacterized protein n=1 Tax=Necator americanus TaxID=51031 RepID=A0ABR1DYC3_NECAM